MTANNFQLRNSPIHCRIILLFMGALSFELRKNYYRIKVFNVFMVRLFCIANCCVTESMYFAQINTKEQIKDMILVIGGSSDCREIGALSNNELFQTMPQSLQQSKFPNLCKPRRSPAVFKFQCGHLLVFGGCSGPGQHLNSVEVFESPGNYPNNCNWKLIEQSADSSNMHGFSCAAFCQLNDHGFVFGGFDGQNCLTQVLQVALFEPYQINLLASLPFGLKNSAAIPAMDSQHVWLVGGWDGQRTIMQYDIVNQACEMKRLLPYPLEGHTIAISSFICQPIAFVVGGFDGIGLRAEILVMDRQTGEILDTANVILDRPKENCAAACFNDGSEEWLAVIGGWDGQQSLRDCELFEVLPQSPWLRRSEDSEWKGGIPKLQIPRNRPAAIII